MDPSTDLIIYVIYFKMFRFFFQNTKWNKAKKKGNFLSFAHNIWWWNSNKASFESAKGDVAKFPIS